MFLIIKGRLFIHPSSVNFSVNKFEDGFLLYFNKVQTTKAYVRDSTMVSAYPIFLFGGEITTDLESSIASVDKCFHVKAFPRISGKFNHNIINIIMIHDTSYTILIHPINHIFLKYFFFIVLMNGLRKLLDRVLIEKVKKVNLDISNNDAIKLIIEILNRNGE